MEPQNASAVTLASTVLSSETSNPRQVESFSMFGDASCGEPLMAQHLRLDFTPLDDVDTDFVQKKCCSFWKFVANCPELQDMLVMPQTDVQPQFSDNSTSSSSSSSGTSDTIVTVPCERTALSMLEFVEGKGLIDRIFEAKMPQSGCSLGSREYLENEPKAPRQGEPSKHKIKSVCKCTEPCKTCNAERSSVQVTVGSPVPAPPEAREMCRKLTEWDHQHPKSMEPPGHQPGLSHCVMQRNVPF